MGQKTENANAIMSRTNALDGREGLIAGIQVDYDEFGRRVEERHQRVRIRGDFHVEAKLLGGFGELHLKKQVVHQSYDASHEDCLTRRMVSVPNARGYC